MVRSSLVSIILTAALCSLASPLLAGFAGTDVFLPSVGAKPGVPPAVWYTTVWVHNPSSTPANVTFYLLERQANLQPLSFEDTIQPGDTVKYEDAVQLMFAKQTFGALRLTSNVKVVAGSRIYAQPGVLEADSVGQYFAATPASFAIGSGQTTELLGVSSTLPSADSTFRSSFGFVETTGTGTCEVKVTVYDSAGAQLGDTTYTVRQWEQVQKTFSTEFPAVSTENARLTVEVTSGGGRVIAFGSMVANGSQDPTTAEMSFRDELLGDGFGTVVHDATLRGDGTVSSPLGIASGQVVRSLNGLHDTVTLAAGANVTITPAGSTVTIAATGGGAGLPSGSAGQTLRHTGSSWVASSALTNDGTSVAIGGNLGLAGTVPAGTAGVLTVAGEPFLHAFGPTSDARNTFVGRGAGNFTMGGTGLHDGETNTAIGASSLSENTRGESNTATGADALAANTTGDANTATGAGSLESNTRGFENTAIGVDCLTENNDGDACTAAGFESLASNTSGNHNTAYGHGSLDSITSGDDNTAVGYSAGHTIRASSSHNTFLGSLADAVSDANYLTNATAIGASAKVDASNHVRIGNTLVTQIGGHVGWTNHSDARLKTDIRDLELGLDFVLDLRPVAFTLIAGDGRTDMGFIAQDVEAVLGDGYGVLGIGGDEERTLSLRYTDLIAPLVKAVQEQQVEIEGLRTRLAEHDSLAAQVAELQRQVQVLRAERR